MILVVDPLDPLDLHQAAISFLKIQNKTNHYTTSFSIIAVSYIQNIHHMDLNARQHPFAGDEREKRREEKERREKREKRREEKRREEKREKERKREKRSGAKERRGEERSSFLSFFLSFFLSS